MSGDDEWQKGWVGRDWGCELSNAQLLALDWLLCRQDHLWLLCNDHLWRLYKDHHLLLCNDRLWRLYKDHLWLLCIAGIILVQGPSLTIVSPGSSEVTTTTALWVKANWKVPIGISELFLSFYSHPNISDVNFSLVLHFMFVQIFQIYLWRQSEHV